MDVVLRVEAATCRCVVMKRRVEHKMCHSFSKNSGALPAEQTHLTLPFCPRWTRNSKYQRNNMDAMRAKGRLLLRHAT